MLRILILLALLTPALTIDAQSVLYSNNFDSYIENNGLSLEFSRPYSSSTDTLFTDDYSYSPSISIKDRVNASTYRLTATTTTSNKGVLEFTLRHRAENRNQTSRFAVNIPNTTFTNSNNVCMFGFRNQQYFISNINGMSPAYDGDVQFISASLAPEVWRFIKFTVDLNNRMCYLDVDGYTLATTTNFAWSGLTNNIAFDFQLAGNGANDLSFYDDFQLISYGSAYNSGNYSSLNFQNFNPSNNSVTATQYVNFSYTYLYTGGANGSMSMDLENMTDGFSVGGIIPQTISQSGSINYQQPMTLELNKSYRWRASVASASSTPLKSEWIYFSTGVQSNPRFDTNYQPIPGAWYTGSTTSLGIGSATSTLFMFGPLGSLLQTKFPFSYAFDFSNLLNKLASSNTSTSPVISFPFYTNGTTTTLVLINFNNYTNNELVQSIRNAIKYLLWLLLALYIFNYVVKR